MEIDRRNFLALSATAAAVASLPQHLFAAETVSEAAAQWHQKIRRVGQLNITEHDPAVLNVDEWARLLGEPQMRCRLRFGDRHHRLLSDRGSISQTSQFLNGRDFTGELVAAAKKRNMRVIARFSPDLNWGDALEAHPEWFKRDKQGKSDSAQ